MIIEERLISLKNGHDSKLYDFLGSHLGTKVQTVVSLSTIRYPVTIAKISTAQKHIASRNQPT